MYVFFVCIYVYIYIFNTIIRTPPTKKITKNKVVLVIIEGPFSKLLNLRSEALKFPQRLTPGARHPENTSAPEFRV